jgi:putative oxidoreductase
MSIGVVAGWLFRILLAACFFYIGSRKVAPVGMWVVIFDQMGAPRWFRDLTGTLQLTGAVLLLIPRTVFIGVWLIGCTMVGRWSHGFSCCVSHEARCFQPSF